MTRNFAFRPFIGDGEYKSYWDELGSQIEVHCFYYKKEYVGELKQYNYDGTLCKHRLYDKDSTLMYDFIINPVTPEEMMLIKLKYEGPWL